jgi:hypothetical protein
MSSLTDVEKKYLEKILAMGGGWVLDYTDAAYGEFFKRHKINIHGTKYQTYQQMVSGFTPDEHTAKLCFQVLNAALASIAGERK